MGPMAVFSTPRFSPAAYPAVSLFKRYFHDAQNLRAEDAAMIR